MSINYMNVKKLTCFLPIAQMLLCVSLAPARMSYAAGEAAPGVETRADATAPYLSGDSAVYQITEVEYRDLQAYMNQARDTLERTLKESRSLNGEDLHARLLDGIHASLSQSGLKDELLLFRYILNRAPELDQIFQGGLTDVPRLRGDAEAVASNAILVSSIKLALEYYKTRDLPRIGATQIPTPDWAQFSRDQIGVLLRIADLAPDNVSKSEVVKRALGWTARALNSDPNRRAHSKNIGALGDMLVGLQTGTRTVRQAQRLMTEVRADLQGTATTPPAEGAVSENPNFPRASYPIADANRPKTIFDKMDEALPVGTARSETGKGWSICSGGTSCQGTLDIETGVGGGMTHGPGGLSGYAQADIVGTFLLASTDGERGEGPSTVWADVIPQWRTSVGLNSGAQMPLTYELQTSVTAGAVYAVGGWVAFEASRYPGMAELIVRGGWSPHMTMQLGPKSFLMVSFQLGVSAQGRGAELGAAAAGFGTGLVRDISLGGEVWLKLAKVIIQANYNNDKDNRGAVRNSAQASITIPMGLFHVNDAIRLDGKIVHVTSSTGDDTQTYFLKRVGATYELKF